MTVEQNVPFSALGARILDGALGEALRGVVLRVWVVLAAVARVSRRFYSLFFVHWCRSKVWLLCCFCHFACCRRLNCRDCVCRIVYRD